MSTRRNFIAGVASSGWTAFVGLLAMPWYLQYLGIESYGMIGVYLTLQGMFALLDMGFSPAVSREVARSTAAGTMDHAGAVVHSMAVLFILCGATMAIVLAGLAPWLARVWIHAGSLPIRDVATALALSAVAIGARWPGILYIGVLNGAHRVDLASGVTLVSTTLSAFGAIAVLAWIEPSLRAFFLWQALVGILHSVAMRQAAWRVIGTRKTARFDWQAVKSIWRFSAGMAAVTATGVIFSQSDKIILSRTAPLDEVGRYTIATVLAGTMYRLIVPAFNVVYPKLSASFETRSSAELSEIYNGFTRFFLTLLFPVAMIMIVCAQPILSLWLHEPDLVAKTYPLVVLLAAGTAIHCIMYFPYALQIARGNTIIPLVTNALLSVIFLPTLFILSSSYAAIGAAIAWVVLHVLYFILGTYLTDRYILPGEGWSWVLRSVAPPFIISVGFGIAASLAISALDSDLLRLFVGGIFAAGALLAGLSLLPEGRSALEQMTAGFTRGWRRS